MLIFDKFPDKAQAEQFAAAIREEFYLRAWIYMSQDESDQVDPFPFVLDPPIVLVERPNGLSTARAIQRETKIEKRVKTFGGDFAGT